MRTKSFFAAVCAAVLMGVSAGGAFAGEVTGPPGSAEHPPTKATGAPEHSNSICSYNGLNDFQPGQGQTEEQTQTPHTQGVPGQAGAGPNGSGTPGEPTCGRGSNPRNP
jgi:hypothetical protein